MKFLIRPQNVGFKQPTFCGLALALLALPAPAQVQLLFGGTAGFSSPNTTTSSTNASSSSSSWGGGPLGDAYTSVSLKVGSGLQLYSESLYALRRSRNGYSGTGLSAQLDVDSGYLGAGVGSYGWRGVGTRLFVGWPTGAHRIFELSYTRLKRGGSTEPVFTYGIRF